MTFYNIILHGGEFLNLRLWNEIKFSLSATKKNQLQADKQ